MHANQLIFELKYTKGIELLLGKVNAKNKC